MDCGSERASDQCPVCGLTSAAAELVFRRRLLIQMAIFLAGSLLFPYLSQVYPPLDLDGMLIFFGLMFFLALAFAIYLERQARARKDIMIQRHLFTGLLPIPFILSAALFLNGKLDSPKNVSYHMTTVQGRYLMRGIVRGTRRLIVYSWREGRKTESLAVDSDDFDRFHEGDKINVGEQPGALAIPWFYGVYRAGQSQIVLPPDSHMEADKPKPAPHSPPQ
ncbi:MAG: hypothetical protein WBL63_15935 [Candidatus Acidiferrum sp.]